MSRERARRREERERLAAEAASARAAEQARLARRQARTAALTGWVPRPHPGRSGILAERQRRQVAMTVAVVVAVNLLTFFLAGTWDVRALVLAASLLGAPVLYTLLFRK